MEQFSSAAIQYFKDNIDNIPPKNNRSMLIDYIKPFLKKDLDILEPSAKTGEFIHDLNKFDISFNITSLEQNNHLFNILSSVPNSNAQNSSLFHLSKPHNFATYDIILGAPPSFYINKKTDIGNKFKHWFVDKTNIFSFYFMRSIDLIKDDGVIAFILPDSFLHNPYMQLLRNKIHVTGSILHIQRLSNLFTKTTYNTILVVYKKTKNIDSPFFVIKNNNIFFTINQPFYDFIYKDSNNLKLLNANAKFGYVHSNMSNRSGNIELIPIIYNKNIDSDNTLELFKNSKQYIDPSIINTKIYNKPSIIISKFYGNKENPYALRFAMCTLEKYIVHQNLYVVTFPRLNNEDSVIMIKKIIDSLNKDKTKTWCKYFLKDGIISKYQLTNYLPIYY
jgi:hypothetical protein